MMDLCDYKIIVTGGAGFLGRVVVNRLKEKSVNPIIIRSQDYDLTTESGVSKMYETYKPDIVLHLAAVVGGIGINRSKPGTFFYKNIMMGTLLQEYANRHRIKKFVAIGTICAYPKHTPVPFKEDDLWAGYPEETNAPYGLAKKMMLVQSQAYRQEFGFNGIYLLPVNLYGPGDNFNPESSHVIPAIIKKILDAKSAGLDHIECWGTGSATREFLYVDDAAEAIVMATEMYDSPMPLNIGSGTEISIKKLTEIIIKLCDYTGEIRWNQDYPDGQPRRCLDVTNAKLALGFVSKTCLLDGLTETIRWYKEHIHGRNTSIAGGIN